MDTLHPQAVMPAGAPAEVPEVQALAPASTSLAPGLPASDPLIDAREAANEDSTAAVYKFVLTGGPCAGKTTALARMGDFFREKG